MWLWLFYSTCDRDRCRFHGIFLHPAHPHSEHCCLPRIEEEEESKCVARSFHAVAIIVLPVADAVKVTNEVNEVIYEQCGGNYYACTYIDVGYYLFLC